LFPAVDTRMKFSLLTIGSGVEEASFTFFLTNVRQVAERERRFVLSADDIARMNPNTRTAPVFRSHADADLTAKIYARVPVLLEEAKGRDGNPWGLTYHTCIWHMTKDADWFRSATELSKSGLVREQTNWIAADSWGPGQDARALSGGSDSRNLPLIGGRIHDAKRRYVPLYEAKMVHQFDHRWATYEGDESSDVTAEQKALLSFEPTPRYWVPEREVANRLAAKSWTRGWLLGWRDIARSTDERTVISTVFPRVGSGNKIPLLFPGQSIMPSLVAALTGCLSSLVLDFCARRRRAIWDFFNSIGQNPNCRT
jgi:hypothetical protein